MGFHERFGDNLRQHCYRYASIAEVCRGININRQQFNRYLSGKALPNDTTLKRICKFLEVDEQKLIGLSDQHEKTPASLNQLHAVGTGRERHSFWEALTGVQKRSHQALYTGLHYIYYPFPGTKGFLMRSLLLVSRDGAGQRFTRLTVFPRASGFPSYIIKSRHDGIVCHNGTQTYLLGLTNQEPYQLSLIAFNNSDSNSEKMYLTGLALIRTTNEFISTTTCIQYLGSGLID